MRPSRESYLMSLAVVASMRSTCPRKHVGCVIATTAGRVLATGFNGSPPGMPHCDDEGCLVHGGGCVRTVHAEANAIAHAAANGVNLAGGIAYVTTRPCLTCAKLLYSAGVREAVYLQDYRKEVALTEEVVNLVVRPVKADSQLLGVAAVAGL